MASNLTNFIIRLSQDPDALARFRENPDALREEAGLTPVENALLLSKDSALIRDAIYTDLGGSPNANDASGLIILVFTYTKSFEGSVLEARGEFYSPFYRFANRFQR